MARLFCRSSFNSFNNNWGTAAEIGKLSTLDTLDLSNNALTGALET
jgi:hypothetical protein